MNLLDLGSRLIHKICNHLQNKCSGAPFLKSPGKLFRPVKQFLFYLYLKMEKVMCLKLLV